MEKRKKQFKAIVYDEETKRFGKRVTVEALDITEATTVLIGEYGKDGYIDLHNETDADRPRC